ADVGGSVVTSTTADLGYSSFMRQAVDLLDRKGLAMVEASNDFDSTDHQGGMWWPEVLPGNSVVLNSAGDGWIRSNYTSWGPHAGGRRERRPADRDDHLPEVVPALRSDEGEARAGHRHDPVAARIRVQVGAPGGDRPEPNHQAVVHRRHGRRARPLPRDARET